MARKSKKNVEALDASTRLTAVARPTHYVKAAELEVDFDDRTVANADSVEKDVDLAISIAIHGQRQPVEAYRDPIDEKLHVVAGRTRTRAIARLNDGFDAIDPRTGSVSRFHAPDLLVWVAECPQSSKEDLFLAALASNIKQNALTTVQEAYAVQKLTTDFGKTLTEAAAIFGYTNTNRQNKLLRLLDNQPAEVIDRVHTGQLSLDAAISLEGVDRREDRLSLIEAASDDATGRVDGGKLRSLVRDYYAKAAQPEREQFDVAFGFKYDEKPKAEGDSTFSLGDEDGEDDAPAKADKGVNLKRSAADLRKLIASFVGNDEEPATDSQKEFFKVLVKYLDGTKSETSLVNAINKYIA